MSQKTSKRGWDIEVKIKLRKDGDPMSGIEITLNSHVPETLEALEYAKAQALEAMGITGEKYAKLNVPPRVDTGRLRNSITHAVDKGEDAVYIGTNVEYAPYIEFGTGVHASDGSGRKDPWAYYDERKGRWCVTSGVKPQHMLKRAVSEHTDEYEKLLKAALMANS